MKYILTRNTNRKLLISMLQGAVPYDTTLVDYIHEHWNDYCRIGYYNTLQEAIDGITEDTNVLDIITRIPKKAFWYCIVKESNNAYPDYEKWMDKTIDGIEYTVFNYEAD